MNDLGVIAAASRGVRIGMRIRAVDVAAASQRRRGTRLRPGSAGVLRFVVTQPAWLLGITIGAGAFVLHAAALKLGAIALVQPIMITGVVLAVPVRAALDRSLPTKGELRSVLITALGLAAFLVVANPVPSTDVPDRQAALLATLLASGSPSRERGRRTCTASTHARIVARHLRGSPLGLVAGLLKLIWGSSGIPARPTS